MIERKPPPTHNLKRDEEIAAQQSLPAERKKTHPLKITL